MNILKPNMKMCQCGHFNKQHPDDGPCEVETCECDAYLEICPACHHPKSLHKSDATEDSRAGRCVRIKTKATLDKYGSVYGLTWDDKDPDDNRAICGCSHYPPQPGS
jgi:hypothetical protein